MAKLKLLLILSEKVELSFKAKKRYERLKFFINMRFRLSSQICQELNKWLEKK